MAQGRRWPKAGYLPLLLYNFHLKKHTGVKARCLSFETYGEETPSERTCKDVKGMISVWRTKNVQDSPKCLKMPNCKPYWMKIHLKRFQNSRKL